MVRIVSMRHVGSSAVRVVLRRCGYRPVTLRYRTCHAMLAQLWLHVLFFRALAPRLDSDLFPLRAFRGSTRSFAFCLGVRSFWSVLVWWSPRLSAFSLVVWRRWLLAFRRSTRSPACAQAVRILRLWMLGWSAWFPACRLCVCICLRWALSWPARSPASCGSGASCSLGCRSDHAWCVCSIRTVSNRVLRGGSGCAPVPRCRHSWSGDQIGWRLYA